MALYGADICARRLEYMKDLSDAIERIFFEMTDGRERPSLSYRSSAIGDGENADVREIGKARLFEALTQNIDREIITGATLYGAHKDDIQVRLNSKDAKIYASQGQQRSLALSMKLAEGEISRKISGEYPVFLLDDVLSELDSDRRRFVLRSLCDRQLIVTSCEPDIFRSMDSGARLIEISGGSVLEVCDV